MTVKELHELLTHVAPDAEVTILLATEPLDVHDIAAVVAVPRLLRASAGTEYGAALEAVLGDPIWQDDIVIETCRDA